MATQLLATLAGFRDPTADGTMQNIRRRAEVLDVGFPASNGLPGAEAIYPMRGTRTAGGPVGLVFWEATGQPDKTATSPTAPVGTIIDIGIEGRVRLVESS